MTSTTDFANGAAAANSAASSAPDNEATAAAFIAEIRRHCADLPVEEIDELTDGLSADLADRLAEGVGLGDPAEYATELRAAAGLPPQSAAKHRTSLRERMTGLKTWWNTSARRRAVSEFLATLAPVWWVLRGAMVAAVWVFIFGGFDPFGLLIFVAAVIVSVQWGRGRWQPNKFVVWLRRLGSTGAILALVVLGPTLLGNMLYASSASNDSVWVPEGLMVDGQQVNNVFAYDCWGTPIVGVQLFREDGQPLNGNEGAAAFDEARQTFNQLVPNELTRGPGAWNVFPLATQDESAYGNGLLVPTEFPFTQVPMLSNDCPVVLEPEAAGAFKLEADPRANDAASKPKTAPAEDAAE